jgi:hypothetical protein
MLNASAYTDAPPADETAVKSDDFRPAKEIVFMAEDFRGGGVTLDEAREVAKWANALNPLGKTMLHRVMLSQFYAGQVCEGACMSDDD